MPSRKYIDKKKCQHLGGGIWYDPDEDIFFVFDKVHHVYIEIDTDSKDNIS